MKLQGSPVKVIEFRTVSPLFEMERSGEKPFTIRKIDKHDQRFIVLTEWFNEDAEEKSDLVVRIINPASGEKFWAADGTGVSAESTILGNPVAWGGLYESEVILNEKRG